MQKLKGRLRWLLFRHPVLYYIRFYLYKRPYNKSIIDKECYNDYNPKTHIPKLFYKVNNMLSLAPDEGLDKAIKLAKELRLRIPGGRGLGLSSEKALDIMIKGEGGTCSDITQAYNNFCIINDIKVREWGIVDKVYDANFGHAFNEYYCKELQKWILLDISKCIYFLNTETNQKMGAIEVFNAVKNNQIIKYISFLPNPELHFNKNLDQSVKHIYLEKDRLPFLITNYNIKFYDKLLNTFQSWLPTFIIHFLAVLIFKNVKFILLREPKKTLKL